jgi:ATP-dependent DNA helicase RecG
LAKIAETSRTSDGGLELSGFERDFFPIYPATAKLQSWDIYACVRQVLDVLDPVPEVLPESFVREHDLISEDRALRDIHLAESATDRDRAQQRLTYDEALGLQWALAERRNSELGESGPDCSRH